MKILIAEDSKYIREKLKTFLEEFNHTILESDNGLEAIDLYKKKQPDVVIMDIIMPKLDGIAAMQKILNEYPDANIIMTSSMGQQTKIIEAIQKGATDFITKPFDPVKLLKTLEKIKL